MKRLLFLCAVFSCGEDKHNIHVPEQKPPIINVEPQVDPQPNIPPAVSVEAPKVQVDPPQVNFQPPNIDIPPAQVTIQPEGRQDPPGIDNIEFTRVKCESSNIPGKQAFFCIYGLKVVGSDEKEHTKYYTCLITGYEVSSCNPIELF